MSKNYIGLDLGQQSDYTALSVIQPVTVAGVVQYHVKHLERFKLGTPYDVQVGRVREIFGLIEDPVLIVDQTGVGRAVYDMFNCTGLDPIGISIHGGDQVVRDGSTYRVPKRDLVAALTIVFQAKRLKIAAGLPEAETLQTELLNFKIKVNLKGHDTYEAWRESVHDDLVLSVAMAVWYARKDEGSDIPLQLISWGWHPESDTPPTGEWTEEDYTRWGSRYR
jgi:hypothetical protein